MLLERFCAVKFLFHRRCRSCFCFEEPVDLRRHISRPDGFGTFGVGCEARRLVKCSPDCTQPVVEGAKPVPFESNIVLEGR